MAKQRPTHKIASNYYERNLEISVLTIFEFFEMQPTLLDRFRLATSRAIAIVLLPVLLVRLGNDFLHSHAAHGVAGASISAPCEACDIQATVALDNVAPPV